MSSASSKISPANNLIPMSFLLILAIFWVFLVMLYKEFAIDFFPIHFAANHVLLGQSPYGEAATQALQQEWQAPFSKAGIAYPLPLILLIIPFSLLPFRLAAIIWVALGIILSYLCLNATRTQTEQTKIKLWYFALPLLFLPFYRSVILGQATLVWFGLAALMIYGIQRSHPRLVAFTIIALALKPQNGIIFALYGAYWLLRYHRSSFVLAFLSGLALLGLSFLVQPAWLTAWIEQVAIYNSIVQPPSLLPWSIVFIVLCWRMPWWALLAIAQALLFPLSDLYSGLPLLLAWCAFPVPTALIGAAVSWLWMILSLPNNVSVYTFLILVPMLIAVFIHYKPLTQEIMSKVRTKDFGN